MKNTRGFTLIELSIVLVIIGLIVGGVLVGRDLIKAAELRSVITDIENFKAAMNTFRMKHDCIPGDCPNATTVFGIDSLGCPSGGGSTGTCNGNGDLTIDWTTEAYRAWQQLGFSNLIAGKYSGVQPATVALLFRAVPESRITNAGYQIINQSQGDTGWTTADAGILKNIIRIGLPSNSAPPRIGNPALSSKDTFSLDQKIDDGKPGAGNIWTHGSWTTNCMTTLDTTSTYIVTQTIPACLPQFTLNTP